MNGMISSALFLVMISLFLAQSLTLASLVDSSASKTNSFVRHQFVSRSIRHLEAVEDYHIVSTNFNRLMAVGDDKMDQNGNDKEWSHHWQTTNMAALSFPLVDNNNNKKNNNGNYHSMSSNGVSEPQGHFYSEGRTWFEPFPSTIEISFKVFGVSHHYRMKVKRDLFSDDVGLKVDGQHYKYMRATYTADAEEVGTINDLYPSWAVVTLDLDGRFTAVICKNGTVLNIDPSDIHLDEIAKGSHEESQLRVKDAKYNPHAMLAYHISLKDADFASHLHGITVNRTYPYPSISIAIDDNSFNNNSVITDHSNDSSSAPPPSHPSSSPPSSSSSSPSGRRLLMSRWTNCFPNDSSRRTVRLGVATDTGYFIRQLSSVSRVQNAISSVIASVNNVFGTQINIDFRVDDTVIKTRLDGDAWNNLGGSCRSMETELDQFTQWRTTSRANSLGLWTLFTDCTNIQGVIGIAYVGALCMRDVSTSLANFGPPQWVTLAHELGHNFGANHPFETNTKTKGDWGGLMDYGSHKIKGRDDPFANKGEYAFASTPNSNARTNKDEICSLLSTRVNINSWPSYMVPYNECWVV